MSEVEEIGCGKFIRLVKEGTWEYVHRVNSEGIVVLVPVTDAGELVLIDQYRPAIKKRVIELPAGLSGDDEKAGEELSEAAHRELLEETGYVAQSMEYLIEGPISSGLSTEVVTFFRASGLKKEGEGGGDDSEDITVHLVPLDTVVDWVRKRIQDTGCTVDPKVFAGIFWAQQG